MTTALRASIPALSALALTLTLAPGGRAQEPELVTDRPDQTESAVVVPTGTVQVELGWSLTREDEGPVSLEGHQLPGTLVRLGLARRFELRLGWDGWLREELSTPGPDLAADGLGDLEIGGKILLAEARGRRPQVALLLATSLPVGEEGFSSERSDPSFRLSLGHSLSDRLSFGYNLGMRLETGEEVDDRDTLSFLVYTAALGISLSDRLGAFVELFGDLPASAPGGPANSFDGGFTYLLRDNLQLDLAAGVGLSDAAADWFLGLGVSFRLPR